MRRFLRNNGLSLVLFALFAIFLAAQSYTGWQVDNEDRTEHDKPPLAYTAYLQSGHFIEATFENWESEFLQMGMYVVLTAFLYQRGSSESKPIDGKAPQDEDPRADPRPDAPWPVQRGGLILKVYENSLAIAFFVLFFASWALHAMGGVAAYNSEGQQHGQPAISVWEYAQLVPGSNSGGVFWA